MTSERLTGTQQKYRTFGSGALLELFRAATPSPVGAFNEEVHAVPCTSSYYVEICFIHLVVSTSTWTSSNEHVGTVIRRGISRRNLDGGHFESLNSHRS